ncbi:MAG: PEP-CTERM sorting domain-containing protein [Armatimonadetes bacterium]|nr:PEP-CTERM sorting domain-containing protein [Armatimonadota bacterium]
MKMRSFALLLSTLLLVGSASIGSANMILNGDFESNSASGDMYNLSNGGFTSTMSNTTGYGSGGELDIMTTSTYGFAPQSGSWKVGMATGIGTDAFSFDLSGSILNGTSYTLSFYAAATTAIRPGTGPVDIGISTSATSFGTQVYTTGTGISGSGWQYFTTTFTAGINASYLTVQCAPTGGDISWIHVDNFSLTAVPEPGSLAVLGLGAFLLARRRR